MGSSLLQVRKCSKLLSRSFFNMDAKVNFPIPLNPSPWSVDDFEEDRQRFGKTLSVFQQLTKRLVENIKDPSKAKLTGWLTADEMYNATHSPEVEQKVNKDAGFFLTQQPFHIPIVDSSMRQAIANNWNIIKLRGYDKTFTVTSFLEAATPVFDYVTKKIYEGNLTDLEGQISDVGLNDLENGLNKLNEKQRQLLNISSADFYQIDHSAHTAPKSYLGKPFDIAKVELRRGEETFVDVMMLYVCVYNYNTVKDCWPNDLPVEYGFELPKVVFCNYVFSKKVKPKVERDWTISNLNYVAVP